VAAIEASSRHSVYWVAAQKMANKKGETVSRFPRAAFFIMFYSLAVFLHYSQAEQTPGGGYYSWSAG